MLTRHRNQTQNFSSQPLKCVFQRVVDIDFTVDTLDIVFFVIDAARLFKNGRSQAVRLPKKYRFSGDHVFLRKFGNGVILMPKEETWDSLIESVELFSDDFLEDRDQGSHDKRERLFE